MANWTKALKRAFNSDAWENVVTLLGTSYDKQLYHRIYPESWYSCDELEDLYYGDSYAQRIVREPVDAAFRQGFNLIYNGEMDAEDVEEDSKRIKEKLWDLGAVADLKEALYWGRRDGRGALLLGLNDGRAENTELVVEGIRSFEYVEVVECKEFYAESTYRDPQKEKYGLPEIWQITRSSDMSSVQTAVHETRLLLTRGVPTSRKKRLENDWRDASVLQAPYRYLRNWDSANAGAANMLTDASQAVLKIQDFIRMLASEDISVFTNRMRILEMARSLRVLPIDADKEDFSYVERTFAGVADLMDRSAQALAGAVGMPQTVLFGRAPAGLNATGESDIRGWYDEIEAERAEKYQRLLETLVYYAAIDVGADTPESWGVVWHPLWQESAREQADREKVIADMDAVYVNMGALTVDEVSDTRFGGDEFNSGVVQRDEETRDVLREMDRERLQQGAFQEPTEEEEDPAEEPTEEEEEEEEE